MKDVRLVLTGGGSGGHIYPGIAAAQQLIDSGTLDRHEMLWLCSKHPKDREILEAYCIPYEQIPSGKLRRYASWENITDIGNIVKGLFRSLKILRALRPACVFSKGGYVSVPVVYAAWMLNIPVVSHESDFDPGLATRLNQFVSSRVCIPYRESAAWYRVKKRIRVTGNPLGRVLPKEESGEIDIPDDRLCVLIHGGSLGSGSFNAMIWEMLPWFPESVHIIHVLGQDEHRTPPVKPGYHHAAYLEQNFSAVLQRSDLVISRAGAGAIWEQAAAGKAMVLFPLGREVSRGDQERNARYFADKGAALCFFSSALDTQQAIHDILTLIRDPKKRQDLAGQAASLVHNEGARRVAQCLEEYLVSRS